MGGPPDLPGINIESPYSRDDVREVKEAVIEERNFDVCQPKESVVKKGRLRRRKKCVYIHLADNDGDLYWNILIIPPDDHPQHFRFPA